jgi:hypothetical protein
MTDYTTLAAVRSQLGLGDSDTGDDTLISTYVSQASQAIDTHTDRSFIGTNGTLTYDCQEPIVIGRTLYFDRDVLGVYSVTNGDSVTVSSSEYRLLPANSTPKYAMEILPSSSKQWTYTTDWQDAITVAGTLGYCSEANRPADITLAATKLAAWLYQNRDNTGESTRYADGSTSIPAEAPAIVLRLLSKYVRSELFT